MNKTSTSSQKNKKQSSPEQRTPKPETIALIRYFARTFNPASTEMKGMCGSMVQ